MNQRLPYWVAALHLPDVGPRTLARWLQHFVQIDAVFLASVSQLREAQVPEKHILSIKKTDWALIENELKWAEDPLHHIISLEDPDYPDLLKEISDPPVVLYVQGNKKSLATTQLAIIGARNASIGGAKIAEQFAKCLVEGGFTITSGLASGIDKAAHEGALRGKGLTIGVAGTGLRTVYPASNKTLVKNIINNDGAVMSEFPLSMPPKAMNFPRRNRIISGLCRGVVVVEAALKSGSLITARHALDQGREVFAIPGSIHHPLSKGCHYLIQQGAKLVETAGDILDELGAIQTSLPLPATTVPPDNRPALDTEERALFAWISDEITSLDVIILRSGLTAGKISSILLRLELSGYIQSAPGGYSKV